MRFKDLAGNDVEGAVWCEGPKDKTVWVLVPGRRPAVVNPTKAQEVAYDWPVLPSVSVPAPILDDARLIAGLWPLVDANDPEMQRAQAVLRLDRLMEQARTNTIAGHGCRLSISTKRLRELYDKDQKGEP